MPHEKSPNPEWKPKDGAQPPQPFTYTSIDPNEISTTDAYKILIGSIVPRPIAFISTVSKEGRGNLAPFSFFNGVSSNPPALMFAIAARPDGAMKDTLRNIIDTNEFVVNSVSEWMIEPTVYSAGDFPSEINELEEVGLTPIASDVVIPPRIKESAIQFECTRYADLQVGDGSPGSSTVIVGKIERFHIASHLYKNGRIILEHLKPVGRIGGTGYTTVAEAFNLPIPKI